MKTNKVFRCIYSIVLVLFLALGAALAVQLAMVSDAEEFYSRIAETDCRHLGQKTDMTQSRVPADEKKKDEGLSQLSRRVVALGKKYPEVVAWIRIPGTDLDYPVMLGEDNRFYLDHLPDGSKNSLGSLFLDVRCRKSSSNVIIYGHNGSGGRMFGMLKRYEEQEFYSSHSSILLAVADAQYRCRIFAVRRVEAGSDAYTMQFETGEAFARYVRQAKSDAVCSTDLRYPDKARILTLSTCTGWGNERLLVQAFIW